MDENFLRFLMVAGFMSITLLLAALAGELSSYTLEGPFEDYYPARNFDSVSSLLSSMPIGDHVSISGKVSYMEEDYVSEKGNSYQQFFITDGKREVKVFCSKKTGEVDIDKGVNVSVRGKLQKYFDTLEIYSDCSDVIIKKK